MPTSYLLLSIFLAYMVLPPALVAQDRGLLWTDRDAQQILRGNLQSRTIDTVITAQLPAAFIFAGQDFYWHDSASRTIRAGHPDSTETRIVIYNVEADAFPPTGQLAVNAVLPTDTGGFLHLFWFDAASQTIRRFESPSGEIIPVAEGNVTSMAFADSEGMLYWTTNNTLYQADVYDLSVTVLADGLQFAHSVAVDSEGSRVYWIEGIGGKDIKSIPTSGGTPTTLIEDVYARALTIDSDENILLWFRFDQSALFAAGLDGRGAGPIANGVVSVQGMIPHMQYDPLRRRVCWLTSVFSSPSVQCLYMKDLVSFPYLTGVSTPTGVAYFAEEDRIYLTDAAGTVLRARLDGTGLVPLLSAACGIGSFGDTRIDPVRNKVWWGLVSDCGAGATIFGNANLDGTAAKLLDVTIDPPTDFALNPLGEEIYWSTSRFGWGSQGAILRTSYDGSGYEKLFDTGTANPLALAITPEADTIYWTEHETHRILRARRDGSGREILVENVDEAWGLALDAEDGRMYWSEQGSGRIRAAHLDGTRTEDLFTGLAAPTAIALYTSGKGASVPDDLPGTFAVQLFPNPATTFLAISVAAPPASHIGITLYDLLGRKVERPATRTTGSEQEGFRIDLTGLPAGMYFCRVEAGNRSRTLPVIVIE